jgi:hypothetical protein
MLPTSFAGVSALRLERDGTMSVTFADGRRVTAPPEQNAFEPTSSLASSTYLPRSSQLQLRTTRGDDIVVDLPRPSDLAPISGRSTIYLDQNHWSTLTNVFYEPGRVANEGEREAALQLISLASAQKVILPMSSAHLSETCKQVDAEQRYRRALTIAQLSAGWQLRDPLELRRFEIREALTLRYRQFCLIRPAAVTLEPNAVHSGRGSELSPVGSDLPVDAQWAVHCLRCIGGILDAMLDAEHIPMSVAAGWAEGLQKFATFLQSSPSGKELKRRRTHLKFIADLGRELPEEAHRAGVTPEQMSDWTLNHSEADLLRMPALGLFREILHEKLSDTRLRWMDNDLTDMMYLTAAAGYCDHVVGERSHASHITNGLRRMGREGNVHRSLSALVKHL